MKTKLVLLLGFVSLVACSTEEEDFRSPIWGIRFSEEHTASFARGSVDFTSSETNTSHFIKLASLRNQVGEVHQLSYEFQNGDLLQMEVIKRTNAEQFLFDGDDTQNQLLSVTRNGETLIVLEGAVRIQPRTEENKVFTTVELKTSTGLLLGGTISRVPLLK